MEDVKKHGNKQTTSKIVDIAYRQSTAISGNDDSHSPAEDPKEEKAFQCTHRIMNSSVISGLTSSVSEAYDSFKKSNATIETILNTTEEKLHESTEILSPVTSSIGKILEEPLKSIDSTICEGFDYCEEKLPELKESTMQYSNSIIETVKETFDKLLKEDDSSEKSNETPEDK